MELESRDGIDQSLEVLDDLQTFSHFYGLIEIYQQEREHQQLENVQKQLRKYREAEMPGSRRERMEEGADLWAEICSYWSETGMYDMEGLAAVTPVLAVYSDLGVNVEDTETLEDLKEVLDEGMDYFEPQNRK
ncbi:MAG: hypothetical protein V5A72_01005 [Candidatus Nanohaloarchaea archaeon]